VKLSLARRIAVLAVAAALAGLAFLLLTALWRLHLPYVNAVIGLGLLCCATVALLLIAFKLIKAFLYKVGRRLAFSYFLIGVLPIPMVLLLLGVVAYLLASFFLGHLYRDALRDLETEVTAATHERAALFAAEGRMAPPAADAAVPGVAFAYYRDGARVAGDSRAPVRWPEWSTASAATGQAAPPDAPSGASAAGGSAARFVARPDHTPALMAAAGSAGRGVVGLYAADLDAELSRRSGVWVESSRPEDPVDVTHVGLFGEELPILTFHRARNLNEAQRFFKLRSLGDAFWDRQMLWWGQTSGPLLDLATGRQIAGNLLINLNGTPRVLKEHLYTTNGELDAPAWSLLVGLAVLLTNLYLVALVMALFMIVGLSRAVNRLSSATDAVRRGDFTARIPVRRRDQVGELQRTFNEMTGNLEMLVAASAQKELLEKELALARDLQNSLIPTNLPRGEGVEFATLFEPSAAIGGDYFDVLRFADRELAVIIADVSGHGLSTGLRMAMLKAALIILVEETREPQEILRRLDGVVRANAESRCFVTATLAIFDLRDGRLTLTNAGHPPTYVVHPDGRVDEILLPSSPLGGLGQSYARRELRLERGDVVVWLSDGLFESVDAAGEPFGYDRVPEALAGAAEAAGAAGGRRAGVRGPAPGAELTASRVRDRLLAAVAAHVGAEPPSDDRTLVVMRWLGPVGEAATTEQPVGAAVAERS
jgi:serine phosphatase RsbU (regulator of sigma subunit)